MQKDRRVAGTAETVGRKNARIVCAVQPRNSGRERVGRFDHDIFVVFSVRYEAEKLGKRAERSQRSSFAAERYQKVLEQVEKNCSLWI